MPKDTDASIREARRPGLRSVAGRLAGVLAVLAMIAAVTVAGSARADTQVPRLWPSAEAVREQPSQSVTLQSSSPFVLRDHDSGTAEPIEVEARLFLPEGASARSPAPAVILVHGAGGLLWSREHAYARQLASIGIGAMVVDSFAPRREMATGFDNRLMHVTESMMLADVFAGLKHLHDMAEVDGERVALIGFSYGGMVASFAAFEQVAETFAPEGERFAGHVAYYAPCIAEFQDTRATGAPLLMLIGADDAIVDRERCAALAQTLSDGGARVDTLVYPNAYHQWDGIIDGPRTVGRDLSACRLVLERDGSVRDGYTYLPMTGPLTRKIIIGLCASRDGYLIGRDEAVRQQSNEDLANFLDRIFNGRPVPQKPSLTAERREK